MFTYKKCLILIYLVLILFIISGFSYASPKLILVYVVQSGDTLSDIANEYNISVSTIMGKNNISSPNDLKTGQELVISEGNRDSSQVQKENINFRSTLYEETPGNDFSLEVDGTYAVRINSEQSLPEVDIPDSEIIEYNVKRGDTLYDLAREFNTTSGVIMALNDLDNNIVRVGQLLKMPINNLSERQVLARTISQREKKLLARVIHAEARGEPFQGQVAVGAVVLNRIIDSRFPDNVQDVVYQSGQFTAVYDGQINLNPNHSAFEAAERALNGLDPTLGSIYYYNPEIAENDWWFADKTVNVIIGEHVFAE